MVLRVGQKRGRILLANDRHALRSARAEKDEGERHEQFILANAGPDSKLAHRPLYRQIQPRNCNMLTTLRIKNLALVADLTLELQPGYNVITGETGAGKSILIGALNLALGERADRTLIRSGSDSCSVEAVFDVARLRAPLQSFLEENGLEPCDDHQLRSQALLHQCRHQPPVHQRLPHHAEHPRRPGRVAGGHSRPARAPVAAASRPPARHPGRLWRSGWRARGLRRPRPPPRRPRSREGGVDRGREDLRAAARPAPLSGRAKLPPPASSRRKKRRSSRTIAAPATPPSCSSSARPRSIC